ncbi:MAG: hypothetical protein ACJ796_02190 [Gemmatimonadaceae bacterium]
MPDSYDSSRSLLEEAIRSARQIVVEDVVWLVYELALPFDRRSTPSLIFENEQVMRRIRNYPANWRTLSDEDLFALSWGV